MRPKLLPIALAIVVVATAAIARAQVEPLPASPNPQQAAYEEPFNPPFPPWDLRQAQPGYPNQVYPPPTYAYPASPGVQPPEYQTPGCPPQQPYPYALPYAQPLAPEQQIPLGAVPKPSDAKDGMLQRLAFFETWLPILGPHGQGNWDLEGYAMLGVPIPSRESPILVTPGIQAHYWDNAMLNDPNLPTDLYDAYIEFLWLHKWSDEWQTYMGLTPGWHGDWKDAHERAWRLEGQLIFEYTYSPEMKYVAGFKYLDRPDVWGLPIVGFVWTPNDDIKYEAVFPKPKLAHRICCEGCDEWWLYYGGELGGGIWGMEHTDGSLDVVYSKDYRFLVGIENKSLGGWACRVELGFVFGRRIQFASGLPEVDPADTLLLRTALVY